MLMKMLGFGGLMSLKNFGGLMSLNVYYPKMLMNNGDLPWQNPPYKTSVQGGKVSPWKSARHHLKMVNFFLDALRIQVCPKKWIN